jgi:hypothetical protein
MTSAVVDFVPSVDPLLRDAASVHALELQVLGLAVRFETNSRYVLDVVEEAFGPARPMGTRSAPASLRVRVIVHGGSEPLRETELHAPVRHICPDATRLLVHTPGSVAVSDPARREALAYVTSALVADRAHFRSAVLEAMTFSLLSQFDRHPIHAAAIARDGRAVLLAGPSGSGKSTLAYMAHRAGLRMLSDDRVWVQLDPTLQVWGVPNGFRLLPDVVSAFPEIARLGPTASTADGRKLSVRHSDGGRSAETSAADITVCVLERGMSGSHLDYLSPAALAEALVRRVDPGFDRYPDRHGMVVGALSERGGWRLRLSPDPHEAMPLLLRMLDDPQPLAGTVAHG